LINVFYDVHAVVGLLHHVDVGSVDDISSYLHLQGRSGESLCIYSTVWLEGVGEIEWGLIPHLGFYGHRTKNFVQSARRGSRSASNIPLAADALEWSPIQILCIGFHGLGSRARFVA
jgi:hypothetical protein